MITILTGKYDRIMIAQCISLNFWLRDKAILTQKVCVDTIYSFLLSLIITGNVLIYILYNELNISLCYVVVVERRTSL